ncbi:hypothetical protein LCGC14_2669040 [marine sediment metagenome]|uniref:Uncharacterized protein n=1 Tax=marine sediment metagenome TaxID=412755 RepID=A0A0F9AC19_9ZZZZ
MTNMNAKAVQFEIERLQECCAQYRGDVELMREAMQMHRDHPMFGAVPINERVQTRREP